jgi:two-component system CheB/CheR fusion protein
LAGLPRDLVDRMFVQLDGVYEVRKPIRGLVVFGEHDLGHRAPFPRIDLVVCRNVLIYFTTELQRRALQLFAFSLRRGGYLALGKAESVSSLPHFFALEQPRLKIFRRVGELALIPTNHVLDPLPAFRSTSSRHHGERRLAPESAPPTSFPLQQAHRLLDELTVGVVTVDRGYNIRAINIAARRLLGVRSAALGDDLIHRLAPPLSTELRAAIDAALGGTPTTVTVQVPRDVVEGGRDIRITSSPVGDQDPGSVVGNVLIEVTLVTDLVQRQRAIATERDQAVTANADMRADLDIAVAEVRELRAANEATAIVQSRLHSENEQLQLATEEAQAATEEIETLNEELQATNEELETLNEELQATVEELTTTNDELQAKSLELESLSSSLERQHRSSEDERTRLTAILANMGDAVLVLDADGGIVLRNAAYERLFGTGTDFVPESEQGQPLPADEWPQARTARGETFTMQFTLANADGMRRWFEAKSQPVAATEGGRWSVIVFRDITERSLRRLQEEFLAIASHELRTPLTTLSGSLQLLQRRLRSADSDGRLNNLVERSLEQTRRLQQHIAELMDVARLQGGKLQLQREPFDLTALVRQLSETADFLESEQTIQLTAPEHPIIIDGDANRIQQVVFNLLTNAITHAAESKVIDLRLRQEPDAAILEVEDYGPGVPESMTPLLFSRFFQAEERPAGRQGLGLGLYIAKEITEAHGGTIAVESVVGQGTKFIIRLPTAAVSPD